MFLYPAAFSFKSLPGEAAAGKRHIYIIRNSKVGPSYDAVACTVMPLAARSVATLIKTQGVGDLCRMYLGRERDGLDYNLAIIPESFAEKYT